MIKGIEFFLFSLKQVIKVCKLLVLLFPVLDQSLLVVLDDPEKILLSEALKDLEQILRPVLEDSLSALKL